MKRFYLMMVVVGTALPFSQFIPWVANHGIDFPLMWRSIVTAPLSAFAWLDVAVSALVLIVFIIHDAKVQGTKHSWLAIVGAAAWACRVVWFASVSLFEGRKKTVAENLN